MCEKYDVCNSYNSGIQPCCELLCLTIIVLLSAAVGNTQSRGIIEYPPPTNVEVLT